MLSLSKIESGGGGNKQGLWSQDTSLVIVISIATPGFVINCVGCVVKYVCVNTKNKVIIDQGGRILTTIRGPMQMLLGSQSIGVVKRLEKMVEQRRGGDMICGVGLAFLTWPDANFLPRHTRIPQNPALHTF